MPTATLQPTPPTPGLGASSINTPPPTGSTTMPSQPPTKAPPLRRAVYVHVSDLLSAYNIDHAKLEEELQRVKKGTTGSGGVPTELDTNSNPKKLQPPRGGFNLCVLVGKIDLVVDKHRVDGSRVRLAEVEVADETGRVSLRARDEQIDLLQQVAARQAAVVLRNCTLELFQGKHIRLAVTKWGKITPYPDHVASTPVPPSKMNEDRYLSLIDLSVVALDAAVHPTESYTGLAGEEGYGGAGASASREPSNVTSARGRGGRGMGRKQPGSGGNFKASQQQQHSQQQPALQAYPGNVAVAYGDATANMMRYQGGLHGYGYVENHHMGGDAAAAAAYGAASYHHAHHPHHARGQGAPRQETVTAAHMMLQSQYEMHQRQLHNMYAQQNRHVVPTYSDASGFRNDMFLPPAAATGHLFHTTQPTTTSEQRRGSTPPATATTTTTSSSQFPASPKMNPRAATFDPNHPSDKPSS